MKSIYTRFSPGILQLIARTGIFCLLLSPLYAYSEERVLAVMSNNGEIYQDFYSALDKNLSKNTKISKINFSEVDNEILNNYKIIISIGYKAAKTVSTQKLNSNIIYALIPDDELMHSKLSCRAKTCYKVFINQPVIRYIKLYKVLFPAEKKLVFATTSKNSGLFQKVKVETKNQGVAYKHIYLQKDENVPRAFIEKLNNNDDVLLALPNAEIYNTNNAKSIILSTYHANVPIIAYSKSFVKAGALISLYSSIDNVAEKTAVIANALSANDFLRQKEFYPDNFMIDINKSVARSLNISIDSASVIKRKIK